MTDEVEIPKVFITIHKVIQEGHPVSICEAQDHTGLIETPGRGAAGDGLRSMSPRRNTS